MAHVELSLSELSARDDGNPGSRSVDRWAAAVAAAVEACVLVDTDGIVIAVSGACAALFTAEPVAAVDRPLVDVLRLLDFNSVSGNLPGWEIDKIPPLLAASTGNLSRGLLRVRGDDGATRTVDAISAPMRDGAEVVGSITFFATVSR